jgi:hypothetical protein
MSGFEEIERLGELKDKGLLTEEEFAQQKKSILDRKLVQPSSLGSNLKSVASSLASSAAQAASEFDVGDQQETIGTVKSTAAALKTPLGIACLLSVCSMFMNWAGRSSGWSVADVLDSGALLAVYLFPIGAAMILYQQVLNGQRPKKYWKYVGLLPAVLPLLMLVGDFDKLEMMLKYGGFGKVIEFVFDIIIESTQFGYKLAVVAGIVMFIQARKGESWLAMEAEE